MVYQTISIQSRKRLTGRTNCIYLSNVQELISYLFKNLVRSSQKIFCFSTVMNATGKCFAAKWQLFAASVTRNTKDLMKCVNKMRTFRNITAGDFSCCERIGLMNKQQVIHCFCVLVFVTASYLNIIQYCNIVLQYNPVLQYCNTVILAYDNSMQYCNTTL